jgi:cell division protein FtsB
MTTSECLAMQSTFLSRSLFYGLLVLCAYFAYHALSGDRGLWALIKLKKENQEAHTELETIQAERQGLERRVEHMRPESLDLDLADEQARKALGYTKPDEEIYYLKDGKLAGTETGEEPKENE